MTVKTNVLFTFLSKIMHRFVVKMPSPFNHALFTQFFEQARLLFLFKQAKLRAESGQQRKCKGCNYAQQDSRGKKRFGRMITPPSYSGLPWNADSW